MAISYDRIMKRAKTIEPMMIDPGGSKTAQKYSNAEKEDLRMTQKS